MHDKNHGMMCPSCHHADCGGYCPCDCDEMIGKACATCGQLSCGDECPCDASEKCKTNSAEDDAEIVRRARECHQIGLDATTEWREAALEDLEFLAGQQWDAGIKGQRDAQGRPALTVNRLPQFVRQVTNEQRQSKPSVTVSPVDSGGDVKTAEVLQGLIRNVEYTSNADAAYAAGGQSAAITGLGYWDVCAEYEDEKSFEQRLTIRRVQNPMSVLVDPGAKEVAGDDARWAEIITDISKGEFEATFPGKKVSGAAWGNSPASKDSVRIVEYRYIKNEPDTLIDLPAGMFEDKPEGGPVLASELEPALAELLMKAADVQKRPTSRRKACYAKIVGDEVVEKGELAGKYLQLVRVVGTELEVDGRIIYEGVIRHAKDTQRMLNYFVSAEAEAIALAPKAPFIGTAKQFEGYEDQWRTANQRPSSYLPYNPDPQAPPPQRVMAEANVGAITNARQQAADDLKAVTGIYDGQLGARSNETSGRAILARQSQGQTANFHFQDNLAMAIRYTGRILIDLIPKIYTGPRVMRILGEDGKHEMVPVNGAPGEFRGEPSEIDLNSGRYDVSVSMGPSYQSRRQEATAQFLELVRVNPAVSQVAGDLIIEAMDIPGGKEIAKRIRKTLPPDIRPPDEDKTPPPQVLMQQVQQAMGMVEQLTAKLNAAHDALEVNAQEIESRERIETMKARTQLALKIADIEAKESAAMLKAEQTLLGKRLAILDFAGPVEAPQEAQPEAQPMQGGTQ